MIITHTRMDKESLQCCPAIIKMGFSCVFVYFYLSVRRVCVYVCDDRIDIYLSPLLTENMSTPHLTLEKERESKNHTHIHTHTQKISGQGKRNNGVW